MVTSWQETAKGRALRIEVDGKHVSFLESDLDNPDRVARDAAISFWEGSVGLSPRGRLARWRWRRGLRSFQRQIAKEVRLQTVP